MNDLLGAMMGPDVFFADHTFRTVFFGTSVIGLVAGSLGSFAYLRKQSLISDVISHAALPGTLGAFLVSVALLQVDGRNMAVLMIGAVVTGTLAVLMAQYVATATRLGIDAAMAIALSFFFGAGMILLRIISNGAFPGKGGIQDYLFGNASVITTADVAASVSVGAFALALMALFRKEFALRTFDPQYCTALGFRARTVDTLLFVTIVIATVIGVKAVGLVLLVAFVVTPPAAARQWTRTLPAMVVVSGLIGGLGSGLGAYLSIALGGAPTGPLIVLVLFAVLLLSLLLAPGRSLVTRALGRARHRRLLRRQLQTEHDRRTARRTGRAGSSAGRS